MPIMYEGGGGPVRRELDDAMRQLSGLRFLRRRFGAGAVSDAEFERAVDRVNRASAAAGIRDTVDLDTVLAQVAQPLADPGPSPDIRRIGDQVRRDWIVSLLIMAAVVVLFAGLILFAASRGKEPRPVPAPVTAPPPVAQREIVVQKESVVDPEAEARRVRAIVEAAAARVRREGG